jgi:hypothetical protein
MVSIEKNINYMEELNSSLEIKIKNISLDNNLFKAEQEINECRELLTKFDKTIKDTQDEMVYSKEKANIRSLVSDYELRLKELNKIDSEFIRKNNEQKLLNGELKGIEAKKVERDMVLDQVKQVDKHGLLIEDTANQVNSAVNNLQEINVEINRQGQQINQISNTVDNAQSKVKKTDKDIRQMISSQRCMKCALCFLLILLLILDLTYLIYKLVKKN